MSIKNNFTVKILVAMSVCIIFFSSVGILASSILYGSRLTEKTIQINEQYLSVIANRLESDIQELQKLSGLCSASLRIREALRCRDMASPASRKKVLDAQAELDNFASSTPLFGYLRRIAVLNTADICIASPVGITTWSSTDWLKLKAFVDEQEKTAPLSPLYSRHSLIDSSDESRPAFLTPIVTVPGGWLYVELDESILTDQLLPYRDLRSIFIMDEQGSRLFASFSIESEDALKKDLLSANGSKIHYNKDSYRLNVRTLPGFGLRIGSLTKIGSNAEDNLYVLYILLVLLFITVFSGILVTRILTNQITKPLRVLTNHIRQLAQSDDFSKNPVIESSSDEVGEIGRAVNHMAGHIKTLLEEQARMYEQQKNIEISMLQSQINPHFLYNTLDSIRWMAVIQGSKNIEQTTLSLENLLRNMAKSVGSKITLREELSLVGDYIHIQKVRYVESFDYICQVPESLMDCLIIKFTLQPIVENAILHGIEPLSQFGEIEISAREENGDLYISIEDSGIGMTREELTLLKESLSNTDKNALSGIGVANVDARLKLQYGPSYGLLYESSPGEFTRVTIHIPKEENVPCTTSSS